MAEDFTTYTEVDQGDKIVVDSAIKVSWTGLASRWLHGYVYKDFGVDHFNGDFTHKFETQYSGISDVAVLVSSWVLGNTVGDLRIIVAGSGDAHSFHLYNGGTPSFRLWIVEGGATSADEWASPSASTTYFVEIVRDDDGGSNNTGRLTAYIRTGSHSGVLQDTLVVDCAAGEQNDFRYIYAVSTYDDSSSVEISSGYTQNLDVGEDDLNANDASSLTQVTVPLLTAIRQLSAQNVECLSQITVPTIEKKWLYSSDISCNTQVTAPFFTVKRSLSTPNIECLSQVTVPSIAVNHLGADDISCNTEITVPSFTVKREIAIPNIESSSEVGIPGFVRRAPLNALDISSLTEVTVAGIYKELFPSDIECSSEVEAADLEWVKILKLNATLPMITAEMSGGHGGFLNVELPMIIAEMRGGAQLNVTLPMITAELEGKVGIKADLNVTLPMITAEMTGTVEILGQLNVTLPMITARMTGTAGQVGQLNVTLPMITAALSGYTDIDGQLNVTLPMIEAYLTGTVEREECEILRYEEPELE